MKIYPEAFEAVKELGSRVNEFEGRVADAGVNLVFLASMVANAGDGDHVEVGTLFGASAVVVGLLKRLLGIKGDLYLIDPYNDEERREDIRMIGKDNKLMEDDSLLTATPEALQRNMETFDIEYTLVQEYSNPWPEQLEGKTFVT